MTDFLLSLLVAATAVGVAGLVQLVRKDRLPHGAVLAMTIVCGVGLLAMILTDWPLEDLANFWADHSVLAGVISSLLLVGLVFLVYERGEQSRQGELARGLSLAAIAEGVETQAQRQCLVSLGCQAMQGFLFTKPLAADAFADWLKGLLAGDPAVILA